MSRPTPGNNLAEKMCAVVSLQLIEYCKWKPVIQQRMSMSCLKFAVVVSFKAAIVTLNEKSTKKKIRTHNLGSGGKLSLLELVHKSVISPAYSCFGKHDPHRAFTETETHLRFETFRNPIKMKKKGKCWEIGSQTDVKFTETSGRTSFTLSHTQFFPSLSVSPPA